MEHTVRKIIGYIVENKEELCTFVQNENFSDGVYRIPVSDFTPPMLARMKSNKYHDMIQDVVDTYFEGLVEWDPMTLWLTIGK